MDHRWFGESCKSGRCARSRIMHCMDYLPLLIGPERAEAQWESETEFRVLRNAEDLPSGSERAKAETEKPLIDFSGYHLIFRERSDQSEAEMAA